MDGRSYHTEYLLFSGSNCETSIFNYIFPSITHFSAVTSDCITHPVTCCVESIFVRAGNRIAREQRRIYGCRFSSAEERNDLGKRVSVRKLEPEEPVEKLSRPRSAT